MGVQGSAAHRGGTDPLGGVLRELGRRSRRERMYRARPVEGQPGPEGARGPRGPRGEPGPPGSAPDASVVTTGADGRAYRDLPVPLGGRPVVCAVPVASGGQHLVVVVEAADEHGVAVRVWGPGGHPAAGVDVHLVVHTAAPEAAG
ncbi:hypothetical protein OG896_24440 [Streptomyces sp. NBC_00669]|uniref:hypothetical protein n=1 Tax=Streptomyces sp. NBC_00669 TaxID=2976011 RepID=UPI002E377484|nr:hypothetical protein [Streptomyces sp. NBC_00669]